MLEEFIVANKLKATIIRLEKDVSSAQAAAAVLKVEIGDIVKTIVFFNEEKKISVLAVVLGNSKVSTEKIAKAIGLNSIELATPEQTLETTGYNPGGVPPVSVYGVKTVVDKKVMEKKEVYAGGGNSVSMLKISPKEIEEFGSQVQIEDICEE